MTCPSCQIAARDGRCPACGAFYDGKHWTWTKTDRPRRENDPMSDPTPRQVSKADYVWCEECKVMVAKKFLTQSEGFFSDESDGLKCPAGHTVKPDA